MPYFVRTEAGVEFGPVSAKELREAARTGSLARRDLVRPSGTVDWFRAERVRGLVFGGRAPEGSSGPIPARDEPSVELDDAPASPLAVAVQHLAPPTSPPVFGDAPAGPYLEVLAARGFHVRALPGETVECIVEQGVVDAMRASFVAAMLGRRGAMILTTRRAFIVEASLFASSIESIYLDRIDRVGFGTRTAPRRLAAGLLVIAFGLGLLAFPILRTGFAIAPTAPLPVLEAAVAFALGGMLVVLSRYRALELAVASGSVPFGKAALESETISQIDSLREASIQRRSGTRDDAQIS